MQTKLLGENIATLRIDNYPNRAGKQLQDGSLGCIELWRDFPQRLGELTNCNIIVYDRQGYGKSCAFSTEKRGLDYMEIEADILMKLLDFWKIENPILFGHSDGGAFTVR